MTDRKGEIHLNRAALQAALLAFESKLYRFNLDKKEVEAVCRAVITDYIISSRANPIYGDRILKDTRRMAAMEIGDVIVLPPTTRSAIHVRMKTARKLMHNPIARWQVSNTNKGETRIQRTADGEATQRKTAWDNPFIVKLASMKVAENDLFPGVKRITTSQKIAARNLLENQQADWSIRNKSNGARITRIS